MIPQPHGTLPPPRSTEIAASEDHEPAAFMRAFDERGAPWAGVSWVPAYVETSEISNGTEVWLIAAFTWMHDGPSPKIATIKVTGWSADNDFVLTPAASTTQCDGKGSSIIVRIPARILV
jgi:hypothetical protein